MLTFTEPNIIDKHLKTYLLLYGQHGYVNKHHDLRVQKF